MNIEHQLLIRFRKYNKETDASNWYRSKLMLYYPWYTEEIMMICLVVTLAMLSIMRMLKQLFVQKCVNIL